MAGVDNVPIERSKASTRISNSEVAVLFIQLDPRHKSQRHKRDVIGPAALEPATSCLEVGTCVQTQFVCFQMLSPQVAIALGLQRVAQRGAEWPMPATNSPTLCFGSYIHFCIIARREEGQMARYIA